MGLLYRLKQNRQPLPVDNFKILITYINIYSEQLPQKLADLFSLQRWQIWLAVRAVL
jgi:hypothetical protein